MHILESVKQISNLFEVRHLSGITGNFGLLDRKQYVGAKHCRNKRSLAILSHSLTRIFL